MCLSFPEYSTKKSPSTKKAIGQRLQEAFRMEKMRFWGAHLFLSSSASTSYFIKKELLVAGS
eukprot:scaffold10201_cov119-Cylindrotheca_fusiformis.AAC.2